MEGHLISYLSRYANIPEEDQEVISNAFTPASYKANEFLSHAGQMISCLHFINKGMLKVTIPHGEDRVVTSYFLNEHHFMAFLYSYYANTPALQNLQAVNDVDVLTIEMSDMEALFVRYVYLKDAIHKISQLSMAKMINFRNQYLGLTASQKYKQLLELQPEVVKIVPLMDIASYLDITPQSLSRIRRHMLMSER